MSAYGFQIVETLIVDIYIVPDDRVKKAMNEINAGMVHVLKLLTKGIM